MCPSVWSTISLKATVGMTVGSPTFVPVKAVGTEDGHQDAEKSALSSGLAVAKCGQEKCLTGKDKYPY
jgi:hypothetical protein